MSFVFRSPDDAVAGVGTNLGASGWLAIDQDRIDTFARATGDFQWIHVDPERARTGPFGATIAHGYLTFSLINLFLPELFMGEGMAMAVNYGCDRLRFPAPVPVGSRVRATGVLVRAEKLPGNAVQTAVQVTVEVEGQAKPGCVAEVIGRYYF